jgi:hypothetical protein
LESIGPKRKRTQIRQLVKQTLLGIL